MNGQLATIPFLLDAGAAINAQDDDGRTPLHLAIAYENADAASVPLSRGADPSMLDHERQTADGLTGDPAVRYEELVARINEVIRVMKEELGEDD